MIRGADTSDNNGPINWAAVKASGVEFAYIKVSEGESSSYATAASQFNGASAAGLVTGAYHFARPNYSAQANAAAFAEQLMTLGAIDGHLPPCLDLEVGTGNLSSWASTFVTELRRLTGCRRVMVYSSFSFFKTQITETWMDDDVLIWMARYNNTPGQCGYTSPRLAMHQYSQSGTVAGVSGHVDLDVALMPLDQMGDDMGLTPEQDAKLSDIHAMLPVITWLYGQFAGLGPDGQPAPFPEVTGWSTFPGGTDQELSLLDFGRQANVQLNALAGAVDGLASHASTIAKRTATPPPPRLAQGEIDRIAASVVSLLQARGPATPVEGAT